MTNWVSIYSDKCIELLKKVGMSDKDADDFMENLCSIMDCKDEDACSELDDRISNRSL